MKAEVKNLSATTSKSAALSDKMSNPVASAVKHFLSLFFSSIFLRVYSKENQYVEKADSFIRKLILRRKV